VADELEDLEAEVAELTRQLDESPAAERDQSIAAVLERLNERLKKLREERERARRASQDP